MSRLFWLWVVAWVVLAVASTTYKKGLADGSKTEHKCTVTYGRSI